ncbi:MAG: DUF4269 domain-containing protein [Cyanobacteria bacterium J06592_8]
MLSIEETFILVQEYLAISGLKLSSGVPSDVCGISDIDISLVHAEPEKLLHLMPKGTLKRLVQTISYPAYLYKFTFADRPINIMASTSVKVYDAVKHREVELELSHLYPNLLKSVIEIKKNTSWGTEKSWCHLLGLSGNEYEIMLNRDLVLEAAKQKIISSD